MAIQILDADTVNKIAAGEVIEEYYGCSKRTYRKCY